MNWFVQRLSSAILPEARGSSKCSPGRGGRVCAISLEQTSLIGLSSRHNPTLITSSCFSSFNKQERLIPTREYPLLVSFVGSLNVLFFKGIFLLSSRKKGGKTRRFIEPRKVIGKRKVPLSFAYILPWFYKYSFFPSFLPKHCAHGLCKQHNSMAAPGTTKDNKMYGVQHEGPGRQASRSRVTQARTLCWGWQKCSISACVNSLTRMRPALGEISFL